MSDPRFGWIAKKVAMSFQMEPETVGIAFDLDESKAVISEFLKEGGERSIFAYRVKDPLISSRYDVFMTSSATSLDEGCVYFARMHSKAITASNVETDVIFGELTSDILLALSDTLRDLIIPSMDSTNWGKLHSNKSEGKIATFLDGLSKYQRSLESASSVMEETVQLKAPNLFDVQDTAASCVRAAANTEIVQNFEDVLEGWLKNLERMIGRNNLIRSESETDGPQAELEHWKSQMTLFNSITQQIRSSKDCRVVLGVLRAANSPLLKRWAVMDARITDCANESKDNVKYLYTVEQFSEPLRTSTPVEAIGLLPPLLFSIRNMQSVARYFNSPDNLTTLFVKITNQLISCCRHHILKDGPIFEQGIDAIMQKFSECINLNSAYHEEYMRIGTLPTTSGEPLETNFNIGEVTVFGGFDVFCKRLQQLAHLLATVDEFSYIKKGTPIEGMDLLIGKYDSIYGELKRKTYDQLNPLVKEFNKDLDKYFEKIAALEIEFNNFMDVSVSKLTGLEEILDMLSRFSEKLVRQINQNFIESRRQRLFGEYGEYLKDIQITYEKNKDNPPRTRNATPVAGSIQWSRSLMRRIEDPMQQFSQSMALTSAESRDIVKQYNRLAKTLMKFEALWHQGWCHAVDQAKSCLKASLLVRSPRSKELIFVNFDHSVIQLIRETKALQRMDFEIPETALYIASKEESLKRNSDMLQLMISRYNSLKRSRKQIIHQIIEMRYRYIENVLEPGFTTFTWTSLNIEGYVRRCHQALDSLEDIQSKANDMLSVRIERNLSIIQNSKLMELPDAGESLQEMDHFRDVQMNLGKQMAPHLEWRSREIETAVNDLIELVIAPYPAEVLRALEGDIKALFSYFSKRVYDALMHCIRVALTTLKDRFSVAPESGLLGLSTVLTSSPIFKVEVELSHPDVILNPSLEAVQGVLNITARGTLDITKEVALWGQDRDMDHLKNMYFDIARSYDVVRLALQLTGVTGSLERSVHHFLENFYELKDMWMNDYKKVVSDFNAKKPSLGELEMEIERYSSLEEEIGEKPGFKIIGALVLDATPVKMSLQGLARDYKQAYGECVIANLVSEVTSIQYYIEDTSGILQRKIEDLEDVNTAMKTLTKLRENEAEIDFKLAPIESTFGMLVKNAVTVPPSDIESIEVVKAKWKKLLTLSAAMMDALREKAPAMKEKLVSNVASLVTDVQNFKKDYAQKGPMVKGIKPRVAVDRLSIFERGFDERERRWQSCSLGESLFGLPQTDLPDLVTIGKELKLLSKLYGLYTDVIETINGYGDILWIEINIESMSNQVQDFTNRCRKMPKTLRDWDAYEELKKTIDNFNDTLPILQMMAHKAMRPRHWDAISKLCGTHLEWESATFKVQNLLDANLLDHAEDVEEICTGAVKEADIEVKLAKVSEDWVDQEFTTSPFKNRGNIMLKSAETAELMTLLEDTQMVLGSLMSNRFNGPFRPAIALWIQKLSTTQEVLEQWLMVQALWIYLEAVFSGGDIARQLPQEAKKFQNIDKSWNKIMDACNNNPNCVNFCFHEEFLRNLLPHLQESLDSCQKSLSGYLEAKRNLFPRFFFVSDAQLLEILGQGSDSHSIQPHLTAIYDNLAKLEFDKTTYDKMTRMYSREGEMVPLSDPMLAQGNIEHWLDLLRLQMAKTLKDIVRDMVTTSLMPMLESMSKDKLEEFIAMYPAQVGVLGVQMFWTTVSANAISNQKSDKGAMKDASKRFNLMLAQMVELTTKDLAPVDRTRLETLITIHIHQVDIFQGFVKTRVKSISDFEWLKQARFYWRVDTDECIVSVTDMDFEYAFEYLGVAERLVITPITDRIYISCAQAMLMYYGGAPAGPAGTGKTETTKDMGRTCARFFVTINCSDQMDYKAMGKLFKGIAQSGCWCGFDEVNRIEVAVLSVVAAQIACILNALKERKTKFAFVDGTELNLHPHAGMFVTMNPGYAGRAELPENMKALFRTIAVVVPDRMIIMRVRLAASGFQDNEVLSKKFFVLYQLCEEQLSKQIHYDFGLRNILSVLRTAGNQKRSNPDASESTVLMRVLRDMNISKLVEEDEPLFLSLISDLFPGITVEKEDYADMQGAISDVANEQNFVNSEGWNLKVIQFYEQYRVRHGITLMGPSGSGKSSVINVLAKSISQLGSQIKIFKMNPKAITATQMFGRLDVTTNDWTDGIFSALWRRGCKSTKGVTWIMCDGPVDALWIENLNTVLDDTKTLTLANGDRIMMPSTLKLVFEVENLNNASPATVSRMGMVYVGGGALGWKPILQRWLSARKNDLEVNILRDLFEKHVDDLCVFIRDNCDIKMKDVVISMIEQAILILTKLLPTTVDPHKTVAETHVKRLFVFALIWSVGATVESDDRRKIQQWMMGKADFPLPRETQYESDLDTVYEFVVSDAGEWDHWKSRVPEWKYPTDETPDFNSILVPTVDNVRCSFLIDTVSSQARPVLLIGESGTAKTVTILEYLNQQNPDEIKAKIISFSSATTPGIYQKTIESSVEKRMGSTYGPPAGRKMIVFIDDLNMPEINNWGDQVTNEIVRQIIEDSGVYSLDKPGEFTTIVDLRFMAAMNHPGGGRNDIPARLKRHFNKFNVTFPSVASLDMIYGTIVSGHFCAERGFSAEVMESAKKLTKVTRLLWERTKRKMLPTPAKFHYIFNLRDLSRTFQGVLKCESEVITTPRLLLQLWAHEVTRVIADKFINLQDEQWFYNALQEMVKEHFPNEVNSENPMEKAFFVDFLRDAEEPEDPEEDAVVPHVYEPIEGFEALQARVTFFMDQYNEQNKKSTMSLVLFNFALEHLMRISRVINTPRGNALLVGVGGSGKQSLTRLASFVQGFKTFQLVITKTYNTGNLLDDLKVLYRMACFTSPVVFLFTDNEVKEESFLEYINMILTSGEIPGLFAKDEVDSICEELRPIAKKTIPGFIDTNENLYNLFISRVRDNLHVVLCFSPVGEKFRTRARKFPGLISGCTIDWFTPWPADALRATAARFLEDFLIVGDDNIKKNLVDHMTFVHTNVGTVCEEYFAKFRRSVHVTPKSFLSFIDSYKREYRQKHATVKKMADNVNTGLAKLKQAAKDIAEMKIELIEKEKNLAVAQKECTALIEVITVQTAAAEKVKAAVQIVKDASQAKADEIAEQAASAENDLAAAEPALAAAESALNQIKPGDISTIKKMQKPPNLVKRIMDGALILRHLKLDPVRYDENNVLEASWTNSLGMLSDMGFLNQLLAFPKDEINDETCELLNAYLEVMPDFNADAARKSSGNIAGLCIWISAMVTYHFIAKEVEPKKRKLRIAMGELKVAKKELAAAEAELAEKQAELDAQQEKLDQTMREKQRLEDDANLTKRRMGAAEELIGGLAGERERWTEQSREFDDTILRLAGDVAVACGFMSYCGPFNQEFRSKLMSINWLRDMDKHRIPYTSNLVITKFLADEGLVGEWNLQGLPTDELSIQNAIIVTSSARFALMIDPQGQGKNWLKNKEAENGVVVTTLTHKHFRSHLEDTLFDGRALIIEDVGEELDPVLDNLLEKNFVRVGKSLKVVIGDKECDVDPNFRLYITTKLPNPSYTPETFAKTTVIDFTVTMKGLEDQLLGRVILHEKAELEEQRRLLLEEINSCKKTAAKCEADLLHRLSSSEGNLLDDVSLIDVLNQTKRVSKEVKEKLGGAVETEKKITEAREEFRPVANRGSILYFVLTELSEVNAMYQTSLAKFLDLFDYSIAKSGKTLITAKRITNIIEYATSHIYRYVQRGLYENDKPMYSLLVTLKIDVNARKINHDAVGVLLKGGAALDVDAVPKKPFAWIPDKAWLHLNALRELGEFRAITDEITRNEAAWKAWYDMEDPENGVIPSGYEERSTKFARLVLIRCFRADRTVAASTQYIIESLGKEYVEGIPLNLEDVQAEMDPRTPVIALLSMGSDPTSSIELLAKKSKKKMSVVSMGQGQEIIAQKLINDAMQTGGWVLLQNCHLAGKFMYDLEDQLATVTEIDEDMRVWITVEPCVGFPINLLQLSIKITNEPPQGLKAGLRRSYAWINQDMLDITNAKEWKPLLYTMCFLHSTLIERKKFGPIGFCVPYEFSQPDLAASVQFVQNHLFSLEKQKGISWDTIRYMVAEVQHGGRVTDDFDKRMMRTYASVWLESSIFRPGFAFYKGYEIPDGKNIQEYRDFVDNLPLIDTPEIFGMHSNAQLSFSSASAESILATILDVQPKESGGAGGETAEDVVLRMSKDLLGKLPRDYIKTSVSASIKKIGGQTPLNICLSQEIDRMQILLSLMRRTMTDLQLAIAGTVIMTPELQEALVSLYDSRVPPRWLRASWDSPILGYWFADVIARCKQFSEWLVGGRPNVFWLTGFFNPQGFLTAMKQENTRAHQGWALDNVNLTTEVLKAEREDIKKSPEEGVYVYGLFLEGAGWDKKLGALRESQPKVLFQQMPVIWFSAASGAVGGESKYYVCPLYRLPRRTALTYVCEVTLKTTKPAEHWTLRGVALLSSTS